MSRFDGINEDKVVFTGKELEEIIGKSIARNKRRCKARWKRAVIQDVVRTTMVLALLTAILAKIIAMVAGKNYENKVAEAVNTYGNPYTISVFEDSVNSYREPGTNNVAVDIETYEIGEHLAKIAKEDGIEVFHQELFRVYYRVCKTSRFGDAEVRKTMNSILSYASSLSKDDEGVPVINFESFADCVGSLGFTHEEDGKKVVDYSEYTESWEEYFAKTSDIQDITDDMNLGGREYGRS